MATVYQENQSKHLFHHQKESSYVQSLSVNINIPVPADSVIISRVELHELKKSITINKTWGYAKRHPEGFGPTKNDASNRTIKLDKKAMNVFRRLFETITPNLYGLVFYAPESKYRVISNTNANKLLQKTLQKLGIDPITMHGLRHTHASVLLYRKVDINYVSERLGHSTIETTYKHYSHVLKELREEEEKQTVETFENM